MEIASVWKEEVNNALMKYTKEAVHFKRNGEWYKLPVQMRKPDESLKTESYPCITWYNLMDIQNVYRTDNVKHKYINPETGTVTEYYLPIPFDMYYQLDFWGKLFGDVDAMTQAWIASLPPFSRGEFFNLPVVDSMGNKTSVLCKQKDILRRRDTLTSGDQLYHSTITYAIQGHIGRDYQEINDIILSVNLDVETRRKRGIGNG